MLHQVLHTSMLSKTSPSYFEQCFMNGLQEAQNEELFERMKYNETKDTLRDLGRKFGMRTEDLEKGGHEKDTMGKCVDTKEKGNAHEKVAELILTKLLPSGQFTVNREEYFWRNLVNYELMEIPEMSPTAAVTFFK